MFLCLMCSSPSMQLCILDGRLYDDLGGARDGEGLDAVTLLTNNAGRPLLATAPTKGATHSDSGHVLVPLEVRIAAKAQQYRAAVLHPDVAARSSFSLAGDCRALAYHTDPQFSLENLQAAANSRPSA